MSDPDRDRYAFITLRFDTETRRLQHSHDRDAPQKGGVSELVELAREEYSN